MHAKGLTPVLNISSLVESFIWFEKLGWTKGWEWVDPPVYGGVCSGDVEVFLCQDGQVGRGRSALSSTACDDTQEKGVWNSVWVDDVEAICRRCIEQGLDVTKPPGDEAWGVREMYLRHPYGNVFRVSRGIDKETSCHMP